MKFKLFLKTYYPAFFVLVLLLGFSLFAFLQTYQVIQNRQSRLFELRVQQASTAITARMRDYIQILKGCQAVFYASDTISASEWKAYTDRLQVDQNYPGFQAIAYAEYLPASQKDDLQKQIRRSGHPGFTVKSTFKNSYIAPIIYIEPFDFRNMRAFGFDMYAEEIRRAAMDRAIMTGKAAMTRRVVLVQETNENVQPGFLLYLPVYRHPEATRSVAERQRNIKGFVYNAFRAHDLMAAVLKPFSDVGVAVYDGDEKENKNLLYDSRQLRGAPASKLSGTLRADTSITVGGGHWTVSFSPGREFGSAIERQQPMVVLTFGLILSGLLFVVFVQQLKRRSEVLKELSLAKELEKKKDEFIGIASHELKTPLTSISAYIQLLAREQLTVKQKSLVTKANQQAGKLKSLIGDLLDVSKIQAGGMELNVKSFCLNELLHDSVESVQHLYSSHIILRTGLGEDLQIKGDKLRLEQALTNLLVNAIKYSPGAEKVEVKAFRSQNKARIEVIDFGIGISKQDLRRIFDKFFRAESLASSMSGLGMGLYITNEIVRRHGGDITVESEPGKGSVFAIELPLG